MRDLLLRRALPALRDGWQRQSAPQGGQITLIRALQVEIAIDLAWPEDEIGDRIAQGILIALTQARRGADRPGTIHVDPVDHLARALHDLARGLQRRWHHGALGRHFDAPRGEAVARLLAAAPDQGPRALVRAGVRTMAEILAPLGPRASRRVVFAWSPRPGSVPAPRPGGPASRRVDGAVRDALAALPGRDVWQQAVAVLALALTDAPEAERQATRAAVFRRLWPPGHARTQPPALPRIATETDTAPGLVTETSRRNDTPRPSHQSEPTPDWVADTPHGVLFALWQVVAAQDLETLATGLAGDPATGRLALARGLLGSAPGAFLPDDPTLAPLLRQHDDTAPVLPPTRPVGTADAVTRRPADRPSPDDPTLAPLLRQHDDAAPAQPPTLPVGTADALTRRLADLPSPTADVLASVLPDGVAILACAVTARWLALLPGGLPGPVDLGATCRRVAPGATLWLSDELHTRSMPSLPVLARHASGLVALMTDRANPETGAPLLRDPDQLARDAAQVTQPFADTESRWAWAALCAHVLRDYASKLPGLTHMGFAELAREALPRSATVTAWSRADGLELDVALEPPPLALLLQMIGAYRDRYTLPGTPPVTIGLRLQGGG
ncbi:hypothetical protein [Oceaniovalibus sp. ACAM 378]|uniref:hypothetical protein n=1 Tax=Oceaniovalibus sp. ACAM 378 TaxID=2599923 RepID=UPI0011D68FC1|nr:hypothetical protein [Oceaniovalibus sp. ACAM 378]TYB89935.1 hypothetical protein FQ320_07435 [Oceaniovalibus sp. ACAM 378]